MQLAGESAPGRPWRVGITDPQDPSRVLTTVTGRDFAVATSGTGERGSHPRDPFTGRVVEGQAAATVTGPSLTYADAYATAAVVMGPRATAWARKVPGYETLHVADGGVRRMSAGW